MNKFSQLETIMNKPFIDLNLDDYVLLREYTLQTGRITIRTSDRVGKLLETYPTLEDVPYKLLADAFNNRHE